MTKEQIEKRIALKAGLDAGKRYTSGNTFCRLDMSHDYGPYVLEFADGKEEALRAWDADWQEVPAEPAWVPTIKEDVIVRDEVAKAWKYNIFSHINDGANYPYACVSDGWKIIAPYAGNEHLVGTTDGPAKHQLGGE